MNWDTISKTIQFIAAVATILAFFFGSWQAFQEWLQNAPIIRILVYVAIPALVLVFAFTSYYLLIVYTASLRSQTPLPPDMGKTIGYMFLSSLLMGQLFLASVKAGLERQRFIKQIYLTICLTVLLALSPYIVPGR